MLFHFVSKAVKTYAFYYHSFIFVSSSRFYFNKKVMKKESIMRNIMLIDIKSSRDHPTHPGIKSNVVDLIQVFCWNLSQVA